MSIISVNGSVEYWIGNRLISPVFIYINTDDSLATVMTEGYLDEEESLSYDDDLMALVKTTDGLAMLAVSTANEHVSLIMPVAP